MRAHRGLDVVCCPFHGALHLTGCIAEELAGSLQRGRLSLPSHASSRTTSVRQVATSSSTRVESTWNDSQ